MFLVGTDIDIHHFQSKAPTAVWVSHTGIILPYFIGVVLSLYMYESMAPPAVPFTAFALFLGVALSITAFPVLARIVEERLLTQSPLGMMALGCAAIDDVTAWTILAVVLAVVKADGLGGSITTLILVLVYSLVMVFVLKPAFRWLVAAKESRIRPMRNEVQYNSWAAMILAFALLSGLTTEVIGIHSFFGAFLAGAIIPAGPLRSFCKARFESVASGLLLPLFFAFTGLRTQITLLNDPRSWVVAIVVILCAVAGKLGGAMLAARWSGMNWRDAFSLGALMNTRGLMQLIVLNIGYDLGIVSSQMFAILVLMAITTTFMTAPLLSLAEKKGYKSKFAVS
jgi:Kef-type K+ transport system membrane component KefB